MQKFNYKNYRLLFFVPFVLITLSYFILSQFDEYGAEKRVLYGLLIGGALVLAVQLFLFVAFIKPKLKSEPGE